MIRRVAGGETCAAEVDRWSGGMHFDEVIGFVETFAHSGPCEPAAVALGLGESWLPVEFHGDERA